MSEGLSKEATWDNYAKHLLFSKTAQLGSHGWIVSATDGTVYGASPGAPTLTQEEAKAITTIGPGQGLTIAGTKYQIIRAMEETVLGKKGKGGIAILKGKQVNFIGIITDEDGDKMTTNNLLGPMEGIHREFGKLASADDLLKKKLEADEKHEVIIKSQSKNLLFTQTMNTQQGSFEKLEGKLNLKYEDKSWGETVVEVHTNGKLQKDVKFTQLAPGVTVTGRVEGTVNCSTCPTPQVAVQYKQDSFAGHVEYSGKNKEVLTSAAVGYEGFSVGAMLKTNVKTIQEGSELTQAMSVDGGVQYEDRNLTGTFTLASNTLSVSLYHLLSKSTQYGGKLVASTNKGNSIAIVGQHQLSPDTMVKGKIHVCDDKTWSIGTHVEHKVVSPDLTVGVTTYYDSKRSVPAFGISAQFSSH